MNASDGLRLSSWKFADKTAAVYFDRRVTYEELDRRVSRLANGMLEMGYKKGDKVAYLVYNGIEGLEIIQGLLRAGITLVPINYRLDTEGIAYIVNHSDATGLFLDGQLLEVVEPCLPKFERIPRDRCIVTGNETPEGMRRYEEVLSKSEENPEADVRPDDIAYIGYTSGTTGLPKGVVTSSRALMANMKNAMLRGYGRAEIMPEKRVLMVLMPLVHSNSIWSTTITFWYGGLNVVYRSRGFDPEEVLKIIDAEKVSTSSVVPYMLARIMELPEEVRKKYDVESLTSVGSGSAMLYQSTIEKVLQYFKGVRLSNSYGSSETGPLTTLRHKEMAVKPKSIGRPIPGVEVKVMDDDFNDLPPGKVGKIWSKSDIAFDGYYKAPEKTAEAKRGEWTCAGDLGYTDEDGYFYLADRADDIIVSAGEHIAPSEVENIISAHPKVAEVAVVGIPDEKWGKKMIACIKTKEGVECTEAEIIEFCREKLPRFKVPKACEFVMEFPTTLTGKILKRKLREQYAQQTH